MDGGGIERPVSRVIKPKMTGRAAQKRVARPEPTSRESNILLIN